MSEGQRALATRTHKGATSANDWLEKNRLSLVAVHRRQPHNNGCIACLPGDHAHSTQVFSSPCTPAHTACHQPERYSALHPLHRCECAACCCVLPCLLCISAVCSSVRPYSTPPVLTVLFLLTALKTIPLQPHSQHIAQTRAMQALTAKTAATRPSKTPGHSELTDLSWLTCGVTSMSPSLNRLRTVKAPASRQRSASRKQASSTTSSSTSTRLHQSSKTRHHPYSHPESTTLCQSDLLFSACRSSDTGSSAGLQSSRTSLDEFDFDFELTSEEAELSNSLFPKDMWDNLELEACSTPACSSLPSSPHSIQHSERSDSSDNTFDSTNTLDQYVQAIFQQTYEDGSFMHILCFESGI